MRRGAGRAPRRIAGGIAAGCLAGTALIGAATFVAAVGARPAASGAPTGIRDVLHDPPLLVERGQSVRLGYEVVCQADERGAPCVVGGTLFVRIDGEGEARRVPLEAGEEGSLTGQVALPAAASGFSYHAVVTDGLGGSVTVPAGGVDGPQRVWVADEATVVDLGAHAFGRLRAPDGRRAVAAWGAGAGRAGLIAGKDLVRIGPSAFDVAPGGDVVLLDQVNDRLAVYAAGARSPRYVPIPFAGAEGDVAVGGDGAVHVLDQGARPVVRSFAASGSPLATVDVGSRAADMLRAGPSGPIVHGYPGDLWFPLRQGPSPLAAAEQAAGARAGRPAAGGVEVVVRAARREASFALLRGGRVDQAWRVLSGTELGEIQLAEPFRDGLVVVLRVWSETRAEFVVLELPRAGGTRSFAVEAVEWAESSALGRFRRAGSTLYQLRSAPTGVEIVTFDLGGAR